MASRTHASDSARLRLAGFLETLTAALVLLPAMLLALAVAGFLAGRPIGVWLLPLAAACTVLALRAFTGSWREVGLAAVVALVLHVVAWNAAVRTLDSSWDGLAYHQEAVLRLAAGWNPYFEDAAAYGIGNEIFLNCYPKAPWIAAASVLVSTGHVEAGKLFTFSLMFAAAAMAMALLLRLTPLRPWPAAAVAAVAALNPVFVYQSVTFLVDGMVASTLSILIAGLVMYGAAGRRQPLAIALIAACLAINLKFTALVYVAVLLVAAVPIVWAWRGFAEARRLAFAGLAAGIVGALLLGYQPYVRNTVAFGNPFYPAVGGSHQVDVDSQRPVNLNGHNRVMRFLLANLSYTATVRPPNSTMLKIPLRVMRDELWGGAYPGDLEAGGFGPLYSGLLLLGVAGALMLLSRPSTRALGWIVAAVSAALLLSIFTHRETWWARYVPQAWLLPIVAAVASLCAPVRSLQWRLGAVLVALAALNVAIVGFNVAQRDVMYARSMRETLSQMAAAPRPVTVYVGPFRALRRRFHEAAIDYTLLDVPRGAARGRHMIPSDGHRAFWYE